MGADPNNFQEEDKDFLRFYGVIRNSFHFNGVYFGKGDMYYFQGTQFHFVNGASIFNNGVPEDFGINLILNLISIFKAIAESLKDKEYINPLDE